ncbi:AtpZ/AtpI family protein [Jiulongibacter sediminis]|uniref:ATPase F0F1 n=1 Tax=Jiulongibacter sediminis TaxID=1605367 RepID=A0A0P7BJ30_9BACT|nr:AtpZ/AtpI family protein [Jiulongibacter sediminis]KPM47173.1 hypothetical protein AFM12_15270 [Jiulongibacter sediminis]
MNWVKYTQIGLQMLLTICLGVCLGIWLDEYFQTNFPGFTLGGSILFIFASLYNVIRQLPRL